MADETSGSAEKDVHLAMANELIRFANEKMEAGIDPLEIAAVLLPILASSIFDQNAPHRLGCCRKEMAAAIPALFGSVGPNETQICFVNQRRRVQRGIGAIPANAGSQKPDSVVESRE